MPSVTKGLKEFVSSLNGELTAMAASPKQTVKVFCRNKGTWSTSKKPVSVYSYNDKAQPN